MIVMLFAMALVLVLCIVTAMVLFARRVEVCALDELLVISGRQNRSAPGMQGFTVVRGGRVLPLPLIETVDRMSLAPIPLGMPLHAACCRGGDEVSLRITAHVRIGTEPQLTAQAVRLLLGFSPEQIALVATRILHGTTVELLATLTPEELSKDLVRVHQALHEGSADSLARLGLVCESVVLEL